MPLDEACVEHGNRITSGTRYRAIGILITAATLVAYCPEALAAGNLVEVLQAVWTDHVDTNTRRFGKTYQATAPAKPLYLWMRLKGSKEALARLEADGKLPIRHKWFRESVVGIDAEGVMQVVDNIPIPAARIETLEKLKIEVSARGYFDWRTWSEKENVQPGQWRVTVVYADNSPVICGEDRESCEFSIEVR